MIGEDNLMHVHGVTRTFVDLIIEQNKKQRFKDHWEIGEFVQQYIDNLIERGDEYAGFAAIVFKGIIRDPVLFENGYLNVTELSQRMFNEKYLSDEYNKAYEFYCREKIYNVVVYLNDFRKYMSTEEILNDLEKSKLFDFYTDLKNDDRYLMSANVPWAFASRSLDRVLKDNWERIVKDGVLDGEKLKYLMFEQHEERLKKYGLKEAINRFYNDYSQSSNKPCHPEIIIPKEFGTGPIYYKRQNGTYFRTCADRRRISYIPNYLEFIIDWEILKKDKNFEIIKGRNQREYIIHKKDKTIPILGYAEGKISFKDSNERDRWINQILVE